MKLPDKWYNVLKWAGLVALPAFGAFYAHVGPLWGWPAVEAVKQTCLELGTLIGALIGISAISMKLDEKRNGGAN